MKKTLITLCLIVSFFGFSQNLETKIPKNVQAVVSINGDQIFELISMSQLNEMKLIQELKNHNKVENISDLGFDLNSKAYYFFQTSDTANYHNLIVKLNQKNDFKNLLSERDQEKIETHLGFNYFFSYNNTIAWNNDYLIASMVDVPNKPYSYSNNFPPPPPISENAHKSKAENAVEAVDGTEKKVYPKVTKEDTYESRAKKRAENKKILLKNNILTIINLKVENSIITNTSFKSGKEKGSSAYLWINNYSDLIGSYMKSQMGSYNPYGTIGDTKDLFGFSSLKSNLFFNNDEIKVKSEIGISKNWTSTYKKMYSAKLDKSFYKYLDQDNSLAYFSVAMNTEALLNEYPKLMTNIYGKIMPKMKEEIQLIGDITAIILDEKEIGKLITGNAMFVLNDISEKEVTYTSYSYDDDYKRTEVTKTKMEVIPDFTVMLGSKNEKIIQKLMQLALKHKVVNQKSNYFTFDKKMTDAPFDMYFVVKNGIAFLTNSEKEINKISKNKFTANLGKHKSLLKKNLSVLYVNSEKIMSKVPEKYLDNKQKDFLKYVQKNVKEATITSSKIKGNKMFMTQTIKTSGEKGNSLNLILTMIEEFMK